MTNRRIILNVMIVAMLTFYLIFNLVFQRVINSPEELPEIVVDVWDQPFLVANEWNLIRLELQDVTIQSKQGQTERAVRESHWSSSNEQLTSSQISVIANSWQLLKAVQVSSFSQLPEDGLTALAFISEDSQPLVFRIIATDDELLFYRMIDQKLFRYPISAKANFLPL